MSDDEKGIGGDYADMGKQIGALVEQKNSAYGSAFDRAGDILTILFPHGIETDQYVDALGIVRVIDKMFRIATDKNAFGESPWRDIAGYGLLGAVRHERLQKTQALSDEEHQIGRVVEEEPEIVVSWQTKPF